MDLMFVRLYLNIFILLLLSISVGVAGIPPGDDCTPSLSEEVSAKWTRAFHFNNQKLPLKLEVSDKPTHWIINYIFKFLVEERLGYTDVQFVKQPSDRTEVIIDSLVCLDESCTRLPYAHINLEVWLPLGKSPNVLVPGSSVKDYGPLGPVTHSALMSDEGFDQHLRAQTLPKFVHYGGKEGIGQFQSGDKNNFTCSGRNCDPSALRNELLSCSPHGSGTNKSITSPRVSTDSHSRTLLSWYPYGHYSQTGISCPPKFWHSTNREKVSGQGWSEGLPHPYSPVLMAFPSSSPTGSNCRFHSRQAVKLGWSKLQTSLPLVHHLLTRFNISQVEYDMLLGRINNLSPDLDQKELDRHYQCIASMWVRDHAELWMPWTTGWDKKQILTIAGLFSFYGKWVEEHLDKVALETVNTVNSASNYFLNTEYQLELDVRNLTCAQDIVLNDYYTMLTNLSGKTLVGVIDSIQPVVEVANFSHTLVISPTVESTFYGEAARYPYFFRTVPSMSMAYELLVRQFVIWGWKHVAVFRKDGHFITPRIFYNRNIIPEVDFEQKGDSLNDTALARALDKMASRKIRILIVEYFAQGTAKILCAAAKRGWHFNAGYVWFLNPWLSHDWWRHKDVRPLECTLQEMANITAWTFTVDYERDFLQQYEHHTAAKNGQSEPVPQTGIHTATDPGGGGAGGAAAAASVDDFPPHPTGGAIPHSLYGAYTTNAVYVLAIALAKLLEHNASAISVFHTPEVADTLQHIVSETFWFQDNNKKGSESVHKGADESTGNYHPFFDDQNERIASVWLLKQHTLNDTKVRLVWNVNLTQNCWRPFYSTMDDFDKCVSTIQYSEIFWPNGESKIPSDGYDTEAECIFYWLMNWFNVPCVTAKAIFSVFMVIVITVPLFVITFAYYRRKLKQAERRIRQPYEELCAELADLDLPSGDIILNRSVGQGAYGFVYGGEVKRCGQWEAAAVKLLDRKTSYEGKTDFLCEAKLMRNLNHKNVIHLIGICLRTKNNSLYLIMEFMPFGDLKAYLLSRRVLAKQSPDHEDICPTTLTRMAGDIAEGLGYLHSLHLVHRDVACRNCLVGRDRVVKVSDFGLTRQLSESSNESYYRCMRNFVLPVRWMAPESFQFGTSNVQSDMWSYGIVLYEIITFGVFPYESLDDVEVISLVKRPDFCIVSMLPPAAASTTIARLITQCCQHQWQHRPCSMDQIVSLLRENPGCVRPFLTDEPPKPSTPIDLLPFQPGAGACMMSPDCPVSSNTQPGGVAVTDLHATPSSQLPSTVTHTLALTGRIGFSSGSTGRGIVAGFGRSSLPYRSADSFSEMIAFGRTGEASGLERPVSRRRHKTADDTVGSITCRGQFTRRGTSTSSGGTGSIVTRNTSEEVSLVNASQRHHDSGGATSLIATNATGDEDDGTVSIPPIIQAPSFSIPGIFSPPIASGNTIKNNSNCISLLGRFGAVHKRSAVAMPTGRPSTDSDNGDASMSLVTPGHQPGSSLGVQPSGQQSIGQPLLGNGPLITARGNNLSLPNGISSARSLSVEYLTSHKKTPSPQGHCTKSAPGQPLSAYGCTIPGKESKRTAFGREFTRLNMAVPNQVLEQMMAKRCPCCVGHPTPCVVPIATANRSRTNHVVRSMLRLITRSGKTAASLKLHARHLASARYSNSCADFPNCCDVEWEQTSLANHVEFLPLKPTASPALSPSPTLDSPAPPLPSVETTDARGMPDAAATLSDVNLSIRVQDDAFPVRPGGTAEPQHRSPPPVSDL